MLMEERRLSQADVARAAGLQQTAVSRILNGKQRLYLDQAKRIADFLGVPVSYLADDDADAPKSDPGLSEADRTILAMARVLGHEAAMLRLMSPPVIQQRPDLS